VEAVAATKDYQRSAEANNACATIKVNKQDNREGHAGLESTAEDILDTPSAQADLSAIGLALHKV
jgi:hypothetical protein